MHTHHLDTLAALHLPYPVKPATFNCINLSLNHRAAVLHRATTTNHSMSDTDTPSQHTGRVEALNLTISLCICYTLCIALVRLWIRRGAFGVDDLVVLAATLATLGHTGTSYAALSLGLGKPWSEIGNSGKLPELNAVGYNCANPTRSEGLTVSQASIAGAVTFTIALYISKIGVLAFLSRITKNKTQLLIYHACHLLVAVFGFISILVVTVDCPSPSSYYWAFFANRTACDSQVTNEQRIP